MATFLVTGATGQQGGATVRHLLQVGAKVHALVRDLEKETSLGLKEQGVVLFKGDYTDPESFRDAARGCQGVFICVVMIMNPREQGRQVRDMLEICKAVGVSSVVATTSFWTGDRSKWDDKENAKEGLTTYCIEKCAIESAVRNAGMNSYTILRPAWFHENYIPPFGPHHFPDLGAKGELVHALNNNTKIPHIDVNDIGKFAAAALLDPQKFSGHEIELGNENLTISESWQILRKVTGRNIKLRRRTAAEEEEARSVVSTQSFQLWANRRDLSIDSVALEQQYGIRLRSFEEFLEAEKEKVLASLPA